MAKDKEKDSKEESKKTKKAPNAKLGLDEFLSSENVHRRRVYFLKKKYGDEENTRKQWKKICKEENISL